MHEEHLNNNHWTLILDFDSTLVKVETMDLLAEMVLANDPDRKSIIEAIKNLTALGMAGSITFQESLSQRLGLLSIHRDHVMALRERLLTQISTSFLEYQHWLQENSHFIYIVSGGFKETIQPVAGKLGLRKEHVYANKFVYDSSGQVTGVDQNILLSRSGGKLEQVRLLRLAGPIIVVGDGNTDAEILKLGKQVEFFAYTEHIYRSAVVANADQSVNSLREVINYIEFGG